MMPARPYRSEMIYSRWEPGQGYQGKPGVTGLYMGFSGLGDCADGFCVDPLTGDTALDPSWAGPLPLDPSPIGTTLDLPGFDPETGLPLGNQLPGGTVDNSSGETGGGGSTSTASNANALAAASQIAAALAKAIPAVTSSTGAKTCPAGYAYGAPGASVQIAPGVATAGTGTCLPVTGAATGQWFPFATNNQVMTFAGVVALVLVGVNLIPSGGGRRRR